MNVIIQFKQTKPFGAPSQEQIDKAIFSQIPQMKVIEENVGTIKKPILVYTRPFQADVKNEAEYQAFLTLLKGFGTITEIGKWNEDGTKISCDMTAYKTALNDVKTFEEATFINGQDYTGKESTFVPIQAKDEKGVLMIDELGDPIFEQPSIKKFIREVSSKRPTIAQAKTINCTVFAGRNKREL